MTRFPFLFTWFAVFAGYLPYTMSLAYLNPMLAVSLSFLAWPLAVTYRKPWPAVAIVAGTLLAGWGVANLVTGTPTFVTPSWPVVLAALALVVTSSLAAVGSVERLVRGGWTAERAQSWLRGGFFGLCVLVYFNYLLPYEWKMWLADRTTSRHLVQFALLCSAMFVGIWRMTK